MSDDLVKRARHNALADMPHYASVELIEAMAYHIEELEAKLAKAVEALHEAIYLLDPDDEDIAKETGLYRIVTTFEELKGTNQ